MLGQGPPLLTKHYQQQFASLDPLFTFECIEKRLHCNSAICQDSKHSIQKKKKYLKSDKTRFVQCCKCTYCSINWICLGLFERCHFWKTYFLVIWVIFLLRRNMLKNYDIRAKLSGLQPSSFQIMIKETLTLLTH